MSKKTHLLTAGILELINAKDSALYHHCIRVGDLSFLLASAMGLDKKLVGIAKSAGRLHDIGKISMPESILYKCGCFVPDEMKIMEKHPYIGARYLALNFGIPVEHVDAYLENIVARCCNGFKNMPDFRDLLISTVLFHHEKYNGRGYPYGLKEDSIPVLASIVCISDYYVAMCEKRPYRDAHDHASALNAIQFHKGKFFTAAIIETLAESLCLFEVDAATTCLDAQKRIKALEDSNFTCSVFG